MALSSDVHVRWLSEPGVVQVEPIQVENVQVDMIEIVYIFRRSRLCREWVRTILPMFWEKYLIQSTRHA